VFRASTSLAQSSDRRPRRCGRCAIWHGGRHDLATTRGPPSLADCEAAGAGFVFAATLVRDRWAQRPKRWLASKFLTNDLTS